MPCVRFQTIPGLDFLIFSHFRIFVISFPVLELLYQEHFPFLGFV